MAQLPSNKRTTWDRNLYTSLAVKWAGAEGVGSVSVKQEGAAVSHAPPHHFPLEKDQGGSLTNNTSKTVDYTLS